MIVRVVKEEGGKVSLLVIPQARPPLPPTAVPGLLPGDVKERCAEVLADVERARGEGVESLAGG